MKLLLILLLLLIVSIEAARKRKNQQCNAKKMDRQAAIVFVFGRRDVYLPKNRKEMIPHCREEIEAEEYVKNYAKHCLKPFPRQIVNVILLGASRVIRQRCTLEGTQEYLSHYPCIKTAINFLHDCMDQQVITLKEITLNPVEDQIPKACCTFNRYIECSTKQIKKLCSNDSTAIEYIANKMIKGYASEMLDLGCQGYDLKSEKCRNFTLPNGGFVEQGDELVLIKNITNRPLSVILPFIDIFTEN